MSEEESKDAEAQEQESNATGSKHRRTGLSDDGGADVAGIHISDLQLPIVGMFISATVLLVAVLTWKLGFKSKNYEIYCITAAAVPMGLSFIGALMTCKEDLYLKFGKFLNQFMFVWSFIGACFLTFDSPFVKTGNGYFASWACVVCAAAALGLSASAFKSTVKGLGAKTGLLASSIIVVIAIIPYLGKGKTFRNESIYAICVSSVTIVLLLGMLALEKRGGDSDPLEKTTLQFVILAFFACLWIALAFVCTFSGPFLSTGNGYFGVWAGAGTSAMAALAAKKSR